MAAVRVLQSGGNAIGAVKCALQIMEENGEFNAGKGSNLTLVSQIVPVLYLQKKKKLRSYLQEIFLLTTFFFFFFTGWSCGM